SLARTKRSSLSRTPRPTGAVARIVSRIVADSLSNTLGVEAVTRFRLAEEATRFKIDPLELEPDSKTPARAASERIGTPPKEVSATEFVPQLVPLDRGIACSSHFRYIADMNY